MKPILLAFALALAACGSGATQENVDAAIDLPVHVDGPPILICPSDVESSQSPCTEVGGQCQTADGKYPYACTCLCNHTWQCDQVVFECDGGAHD